MPNAGRFEPGATYIYERDGSKTYARKMGETERILIGEEYALDINRRRIEIADDWVPIVEAAEHNPALQDALDRAKLVYELSKQDDPLFHHPV
jgi:hypothetical protein